MSPQVITSVCLLVVQVALYHVSTRAQPIYRRYRSTAQPHPLHQDKETDKTRTTSGRVLFFSKEEEEAQV